MPALEYKKIYKNNMGPIVRGIPPYQNGSLYSRDLVPRQYTTKEERDSFKPKPIFMREPRIYYWPDLFSRAEDKESEFIWVPGKHSIWLYMTEDGQLFDKLNT
jgi:hypothetical protein